MSAASYKMTEMIPGGGGELGSLFVRTILAIVTSRREKRATSRSFSKMAPLPFPNATFKVGFPGY